MGIYCCLKASENQELNLNGKNLFVANQAWSLLLGMLGVGLYLSAILARELCLPNYHPVWDSLV